VTLCVSRAALPAPGLHLRDETAPDIAALVHARDGLTLAIELAASRARILSPSQMLKKMTRRFALLKSKTRNLSPRQATLQGAISWSWDLLDDVEANALAQASVFEGGFTLHAAEAVIDLDPFDDAPFVMDVIESLVDKSLIRTWIPEVGGQPLDEPRFGLLVSVQVYASQKLGAADTLMDNHGDPISGPNATAAAYQRHSECYAELGTPNALQALDQPGGTQERRALIVEFDNLGVAQERALAFAQFDTATTIARALSEIYLTRGPFAAGAEHLAQVLDQPDLTPLGRAHLLTRRALLRTLTGKLDDARHDFLTTQELLTTLPATHHLQDEIDAGLIDIAHRQGDL